jgi:cytoskeletal protein CcmA (bactofilin family)
MAADKETIIGPETRISGEIRGDEDLVIKGRVDGKIHLSQALTVEKGAIVQADVDVRVLVVSGTLVGNAVASESVRLSSSARVVGDVAAPRLTMESGAAYRGRVDMGDVEAARAAVASRAVAKPAVAAAEARDRVAPPRMAPPPKAVAPKVTARIPTERPAASEAAAASPPAFPRVAGVVGGGAPAWAKRKIRRR